MLFIMVGGGAFEKTTAFDRCLTWVSYQSQFFRFSVTGKPCEREKYRRFFIPFHDYLKYCIGKMRTNRLSSRAVRPLEKRP